MDQFYMDIRAPIHSSAQSCTTHFEEPRKCFHGFSCTETQIKPIFSVVCKIDEGTFGKVFKAKCLKKRDCHVAIKKILFNDERYDNPQSYIDNETKVLGILKEKPHPNIIEFFGFIDNGNFRNYIFELGDMSFHEYMKSASSRLTSAQFHEILFQFIEAIEHLNTVGIYTSDIHPKNMVIFLSSGIIKFIDFGGAKILEQPNNQKCLRELSFFLALYQLSIRYNNQSTAYNECLLSFEDARLNNKFSEANHHNLLQKSDLWCFDLSKEVKRFIATCFLPERVLAKRADLLNIKSFLTPRERIV